jgi:hypothetical protein
MRFAAFWMACGDGAGDRRAWPFSGDQHPQIGVPHHAEGLLACHHQGAPGDATYADMEELIRLGAYRTAPAPRSTRRSGLHEPLESFLRQAKDEVTGLNEGYRQLEQILGDLETER